MRLLLIACAGGALGTGARYLTNIAFARVVGTGFPWSTLVINIVGSLLMGIAVEVVMQRLAGSAEARAFIMIGILGGFTTFSAFSLDFAMLMDRKDHLAAAFYLFGSVGLAIFAFYMGAMLAKAVLT